MGPIVHSVEIAAPLERVYDAFACFEDLPQFVEGVEDVTMADETHARVLMRIGAELRDVGAEIVEQRPCERIAWHAIDGETLDGSVTFEPLGDERTRVTVRLEADGRRLATAHDGRVRGDLDRFKAAAEARAG